MLALLASLCLYVTGISCLPQLGSTWPPGPTPNPGEECLPYDGSVIPDCKEFVDPLNKQAYYHEHSSNCSRYWECGPELETCLFECARCPCLDRPQEECDPQCKGQPDGVWRWALVFDERYHYWPLGPTCVWPDKYEGNCTNAPAPCDCLPWQNCINNECAPQCLEDKHCPTGYRCDECKWCVPIDNCDNTDSKCIGFDAVCHVPAHENCFYCDVTKCKNGCIDDNNCPFTHPICGHGEGGAHRCGCQTDSDCKTGQICDTTDTDGDGDKHECIDDDGCKHNDKNCPGFDAVCNIPAHDNCFYCSGKDCENGCVDDNNCPTTHPICGHGEGGAHRCGCQTDSDCKTGQICDTTDTDGDGDKHECIDDDGCDNNDKKCPGFDTTCKIDLTTFEHSECFYCAGKDCKPGCADDSVCPTSFPICGHGGSDHHCGCNADIDCVDVPGKDRCNTQNHQCEASKGKEPLDSIKLYSKSCTGCTKEGVVVTLLGEMFGEYVDGVPCTTGVLDHKGSVDFAGGSTEFNGRKNNHEDDHEREIMGSCYKMGLNYQIHDGGNVTWVGDGSWEPEGKICVDWENKDYYVWTCNLTGSGPVWQMEGCKMNPGQMTCD